MAGQFLTFCLDNTNYAINVFNIKEVIEYNTPQTLPCSTPLLLGILRLRDENITIMDVRQKFNIPPASPSKDTRIIILDIYDPFAEDKNTYGIIADSVLDVINIEDNELQSVPNSKNLSAGEFIQACTSINEKYTFILDVEKLFSHKELNKATKEKRRLK